MRHHWPYFCFLFFTIFLCHNILFSIEYPQSTTIINLPRSVNSEPTRSCTHVHLPETMTLPRYAHKVQRLIKLHYPLVPLATTIVAYLIPHACCVPLYWQHHDDTTSIHTIYVPYEFDIHISDNTVFEQFKISTQLLTRYIQRHIKSCSAINSTPHLKYFSLRTETIDPSNVQQFLYVDSTNITTIARTIPKVRDRENFNSPIVQAPKVTYNHNLQELIVSHIKEPTEYSQTLLS